MISSTYLRRSANRPLCVEYPRADGCGRTRTEIEGAGAMYRGVTLDLAARRAITLSPAWLEIRRPQQSPASSTIPPTVPLADGCQAWLFAAQPPC